MIETLYLTSILVFSVLAFFVKNIKTYFSTGVSIRGKSVKLTLSILLSTIIYILILLRLTILEPYHLMEVETPQNIFYATGLVLVTIGFFLGILALLAMKNSWRVGIKYDQETELVTTGIYRFSRNPYFLSYGVLIIGYIFILPSPVLLFLYALLMAIFQRMILEEEAYLEMVHGTDYINYKSKVRRYL